MNRRELDEAAELDWLAWLLDNSIPIPGSGGRRIGLDAIVGLVPGFGDLASGAVSALIIARAIQIGIPRIVVARMLFNAGVDLVVGAIPLVGDAFDLWWKANSRNVRLLRRYADAPASPTADSWAVFAVVIGVTAAAAIGVVWLIATELGALL
jgi:hypothetical protein